MGRDQRIGPPEKSPYPSSSSAAVTAAMKGNRRLDTKPELRLRSALHRRGIRFRKDFGIRMPNGGLVKPDIVFTRRRIAVFVDGCFWHGCPIHGRVPRGPNAEYWKAKMQRNRDRDTLQTSQLESAGWRVIRVWEHEDLDHIIECVQEALVSASHKVG